METKDLVQLVKQGVQPIIKINDAEGVLDGPDYGMLGRIISVGDEDEWESGNSTVTFDIDFLEFTDYNKTLAKSDWYDKNGNPTLTWMQTPQYNKDAKRYTVYEMYVENSEYANTSYIEVVDNNKWFNNYLESKSEVSYTRWLELQLDSFDKMYEI